ncbi:MAG: glycosyltransferase family 2 protein [Bacteroidia bacterium]|nr:glycosyltransferase family 2 protein [Bacteroidia bacterium]
MIKISVIIPIFNVVQYVEKAILSVYNQGIDEKYFEVILVDDGSTDESLNRITLLTQDKTNVKIISQKNKGLGGARNTGIQNAHGKYILFLDADDWYLPNTLPDLITIADDNDLDILEFAAQGIFPNGKIAYHSKNNTLKMMDGYTYYNKVRYMHSACNKIYNRNFIYQNQLFFSEKIYIEDFEFNTRAFSTAHCVQATDLLVAQFLQSPNSITRSSNVSNRIKIVNDLLVVLQKTKQAHDEHRSNYNDSSYHFFNERLAFVNLNIFYQLFKNNASFEEMSNMKKRLIQENLFYVNHTIYDIKKNWFRRVFLKNFWLFKISQPILICLSKQ